MKPRPPATWRAAFLRALARGHSIAQAARDAGIDPSSVHRVRQRDPAFAAAWTRAKERGVVRLTRGGGGAAVDAPRLAPDQIVRASRDGRPRIQRAGPGRWSAGKEQLFLEELAATGSVTAATAAAGVSPAAVYRRKAQWPGFAERWRTALGEGWERLEEHLLRAAADTLDPAASPSGAAPPPAPELVHKGAGMTIDQAIIVWKAHRAEVKGDPDTRRLRRRAEPSMDEVRAEVLRRVRALGG
ncbi:MAG: hypothetical protein ACRYFW_01675 [Janthinobacterium lividum]